MSNAVLQRDTVDINPTLVKRVYFSKTPIYAAAFLSQSHMRVYNAILSYQGGMDSWTGTIETILKRVNGFVWQGKVCKEIKPRRASQIIQDLKKWGWLEVRRSGYSKPNSYKATTPTDLLFMPDHSYDAAPVPQSQISLILANELSKTKTAKQCDTEIKTSKKCGTDSRSKDAELTRVPGDATLYKELEKNNKELIQTIKSENGKDDSIEVKKMSTAKNNEFNKDLFQTFTDWSQKVLSPTTVGIINSINSGERSMVDIPDNIKVLYTKFVNEEYPKLQKVS
ncbi:hypothetical protein [Leptospira kirschneri]|uniref:hypothetical protein n=1 Tax=Leptospira kirschneri TaxID=29507 RepID=UPI001F53698D|nr:hypothetical protein [Leptospira kirschneri]UML78916.1 hypothetical protein FH602_02155 [Leptospira kirschneri]